MDETSGRSPFGIGDALAKIADREDLSRDESCAVLTQIMSGETTPAQIGAFLMGLRMKGETVTELAGAAEAMRRLATPVLTGRSPLLDTCGTGGDRRGTYNISTAVAFVAAAAGVAVAKHGNRSVSSRSGSADVLEAAGVRIDLTADQMGQCLDDVGIAFLFAPVLHGAMRHAVGPRRELKLRTLFNLLGPLTNPAGAEHQLLGVYDREKAELIAGVLQALGTRRSWVVHGLEGLDELSISGPSVAFEIQEGRPGLQSHQIDPEAVGLLRQPLESIAGGDPTENARWLTALLAGEVRGGSRDMVVLNGAAALFVAGRCASLQEGGLRAEEVLASGAAARLLDRLRDVSQKL